MKYLLLSALLLSPFYKNHAQEAPKLVVGIVIDQMTFDYLYRFGDRFSKKGFRLLMDKGTNCKNVQYNYVPTYTGPGHASIYTGTTPRDHGIVANDWYDRARQELVNCVADSMFNTVGSESLEGMRSPSRLLCNTITDQLKNAYSSSKVFSVSIKDRGAILPAGHSTDQVYWFDSSSGHFITSSYYQKSLPTWVQNFNQKYYVKGKMSESWNLLKPLETYNNKEDNSPYEYLMPSKTTPTFPYNFAEITAGQNQNSLFLYSPFSNTFITDFAIEGLKNNQLGQDDITDFMSVSYSTPDLIGHGFGPHSLEIEDLYLRLDLELERLFKAIKKEVGNDWIVFITADHGAVPVPQKLIDERQPGGYVFLNDYLLELGDNLKQKFGVNLLEAEENQNIYLNHTLMKDANLSSVEVENYVKSEISKWNGVAAVYTRTEIEQGSISTLNSLQVKKGYLESRSGDLVFQLKSGYLAKLKDSEIARRGTSHGSGYAYDTHVPLLFYGKNIPRKDIFELVEIVDIAPTLSLLMNLSFPYCTSGKIIEDLFEE